MIQVLTYTISFPRTPEHPLNLILIKNLNNIPVTQNVA